MHITTASNISIDRKSTILDTTSGISFLIAKLDEEKGMFLSSGTEYPGRYSRWETGFSSPPIEVIAFTNNIIFKSLSIRGTVILNIFEEILNTQENKQYKLVRNNDEINVVINQSSDQSAKIFREEDRSKQPSVLTPLRTILKALKHNESDVLGFYGAFGYDLLFQFEKTTLTHKRDENQPIMRLFFPDRIYTFDRRKEQAFLYEYDLSFNDFTTINLPY